MAEQLTIPQTDDRTELYTALLPQIEALVAPENDPVANMANVVAVLREAFGFFWVGFYRVVGNELILGPFQGSVACSRIAYGKGVCGTAWEKASTQVVADVDTFTGHIACSSASRSEIVVPLFNPSGTQVVGVLDIDSDRPADFSDIDAVNLEDLLKKIGNRLQ